MLLKRERSCEHLLLTPDHLRETNSSIPYCAKVYIHLRLENEMTVYVDDFDVAARVGTLSRRWSHLVADTPDELRNFGRRLRLPLSWIQKSGTPLEHFDVTSSVRRRAVALGAEPVDYVRMQQVIAKKRLAAAHAESA